MKTLYDFITLMRLSIRKSGGNDLIVFHPSASSALILFYNLIGAFLKASKIEMKNTTIPLPFAINLIQNTTDHSIESIITMKIDLNAHPIDVTAFQTFLLNNRYDQHVTIQLFNSCLIVEIKTIVINKFMQSII